MTDTKKFKILMYGSAALTALVLLYTVLQDSIMPDIAAYAQRRVHYERVISSKGLSLHKGMYWKEKE